MKRSFTRLMLMIVCAAITSALAQATGTSGLGAKRTLRYALDPQNPIYVIPVNPMVNVTVQFPSVIQDLNGRGFTLDVTKASGAYEVSWFQGTSYFTITPLATDANGEPIKPQVRNLNAICYGMPFSLICKPVEDPANAPTIVLFEPGEQLAEKMSGEQPPYVRRSKSVPESRIVSSGAGAIISGVDTMKMLLAMPNEKALADALAQLNGRSPEDMPDYLYSQRAGKNSEFNYGSYKIQLTDVLRVDRRDLMIFNIRVTNTSKSQILLDSESFRVRSGDHLFDQVTVDIAPLIAPGQMVEGQLAIIGSPEGGPNNLRPDNDFVVSVDLISNAVVADGAGESAKSLVPAREGTGSPVVGKTPMPTPTPTPRPVATPTPVLQPTPTPTPAPTPVPTPTPTPTPTPAPKPIPQDPKKPVTPPEEIRRALPMPSLPPPTPAKAVQSVTPPPQAVAPTPAPTPPGKELKAGTSVPIDDQISIQIE